jgi:hypothetical protein
MRHLLIIFFICTGLTGYGQKINGIVTDKATGLRISGALVSTTNSTAISDMEGIFSIGVARQGDTLKVKIQGYKSFKQAVAPAATGDVIVQMEQATIQLQQVNISARRDRVKDSISNRIQFARDFNSHPPKFSDIIRPGASVGPIPMAGVSIVPSQLIALLTYKHSNAYRFKQALIRDEEGKYVDSRFSDERVAQLTGLQADSLYHFINQYRPAAAQVRNMSDYDIFTYIKKSAAKFRKPHRDDVKEAEF